MNYRKLKLQKTKSAESLSAENYKCRQMENHNCRNLQVKKTTQETSKF